MRPWLALLTFAAGVIVGITFWRMRATPTAVESEPPAQAVVVAPLGSRPGAHPPLPASPEEMRARTQARRARQRADIDRVVVAGRNKIVSRYEVESVDSVWANATRQDLMKPEYTVSDQIRAIHAEPSNLSVDCRSTTCLIEADFPDGSTADDWSSLYLPGVGARLPTASLNKSDNADGSVHLRIYATAAR